MRDQLVRMVLDEGRWLTFAMGVALLTVLGSAARCRVWQRPGSGWGMAALNLIFGVNIGVMGLGHLLAVSVKLAQGTLEGSVGIYYLIGLALVVPSWWLAAHGYARMQRPEGRSKTVILNAWLGLTLLALGLQNLPLALPAILNIAYHTHSNRIVGRVVMGLALAVQVALFLGSLVFLASGQSFEQFSGMN